MTSRLRSLGGQVAERIWSAFRLGVQRTLGVASTHYDMDLERVSSGYVVAPGVEGDAARDAMEEANAAVEGYATILSRKIGDDLLPEGERREHGDGVSLEVVAQLAPSQDHCVEQLLDLWIPCLGFKQHFTDEVHRPLDGPSVSLLLSFHKDGCADDLSHGCHV